MIIKCISQSIPVRLLPPRKPTIFRANQVTYADVPRRQGFFIPPVILEKRKRNSPISMEILVGRDEGRR